MKVLVSGRYDSDALAEVAWREALDCASAASEEVDHARTQSRDVRDAKHPRHVFLTRISGLIDPVGSKALVPSPLIRPG